MDKKVWSDLRSRRAVVHRRERLEHKLHLIRAEGMKGKLKHQRPLNVPPVLLPEKKIIEKPGIFRRIYRRLTGN